MISWADAVCFGLTTETDGTAICAVTLPKLLSAFMRDRIPKIRIPAPISAITSAVTQFLVDRPLASTWFSGTISGRSIVSLISMSFMITHKSRLDICHLFLHPALLPPPVQHAEESRHEEQGGNCCENQTSNHRPPKRRILLAAVTHSEGHRNHPDDHGEGGHQHRPKARETRLQGCRHGILPFRHLLGSEAHHQNAVCGGHTHAHDRSHESGYA